MKKIKKTLYLLLFIPFLFSCNSNDELNSDPIIGTWIIKSILYDNKEIYSTDECNIKSSTTFYNDNSIIESTFHKDVKGECINFEKKYSWVNLGNSIYQLGSEEIEINFSNNNQTHKLSTKIIDIVTNKEVTTTITYSKI